MLLIGALTFIGCVTEDKNEASVERFSKVLNEYYQKQDSCVLIHKDIYFPTDIQKADKQRLSVQQAYEKAGLVKLTAKKINPSGISYGKVEKVDGYHVELTPKGEKELITTKGFYSKKGFCAGSYKIEEIINYSKPTALKGYTISRVKFKMKATNLKPWAKELVANKEFKPFQDKLLTIQDAKAVLVLTEMKGWVHEKDFEK